MKHRIIIAVLTIGFIYTLHSNAQDFTDSLRHKDLDTVSQNCVSIDGVFLIFGAAVPGYERVIYNKLSGYGRVGFGSLWFTDITSMYEFGVRYTVTGRFTKGLYLEAGYARTAIEKGSKKADAAGPVFGLGYHWDFVRHVGLILSGSLYFSGDDQVTFEEHSGNLTKTVSVGGPINLGAGISLGITF